MSDLKSTPSGDNAQLKNKRSRKNRARKTKEAAAPAEPLVFMSSTERRIPSVGQLRYFPRLLQARERLMWWAAIVLIAIAAPVLVARGYYRATELVPQQGGSYTEGVVGELQYANPILSPLSDVDSDVTALVFSSLFRYDDQLQLQNDLVTNYELSEDKLTYTLYLRHGVKWHDGEELNVDDVLFTIEAIQDRRYQSPLYSSLNGVTVERIDDYTLALKLKETFAPFLTTLTFGILPEHRWFDVPAQNVRLTELNITPIGSGPFQFDALTKDKDGVLKSFTVVRNEDYYGEKPYLDEVSFRFYPDSVTALEALKSKNIQGLAFIPQSEIAEVQKKNGTVQQSVLRLPQYTAVFFNQKRSEILQDETIRKALATAVNRDEIIGNVLAGQGDAMFTAILPGYIGHNAEVQKYDYNVDEASRLLEEAGWKFPEASEASEAAADENAEEAAEDGSEEATEEESATEEVSEETTEPVLEEDNYQPREKDGKQLTFSIATVDLPEYNATLEILKQQWRAIGVDVTIETYSAEDIQQRVIKKREYDAILFAEIVGSDPDPYPFWHSSQMDHPGLALSIFRDREVDGLLDEARKSADDEERRLKYLHFQNNIADKVQAIFLYNPQYIYAVNEKIQGHANEQYIAVPADRFADINEWYLKTDRRFKKKEETDDTLELNTDAVDVETPEVVEESIEEQAEEVLDESADTADSDEEATSDNSSEESEG